MGVFFTKEDPSPKLQEVIVEAINEKPPQKPEDANKRAAKLMASVKAEKSGVVPALTRIILAYALVLVIGAVGLIIGKDPGLAEWSSTLRSAFQLMLGGVSGLLCGEAASAKK